VELDQINVLAATASLVRLHRMSSSLRSANGLSGGGQNCALPTLSMKKIRIDAYGDKSAVAGAASR